MAELKQGFRLLDFDDSDGGLTAYALDGGEVADEELQPLWGRFDEAAARGMKLRIYAEMHALPKFGRGLIVEKLKRFSTIMSTIERMAIVGDEEWLTVFAKTIDPIMGAHIRHFPMAEKDEALAWLRGTPFPPVGSTHAVHGSGMSK
jgi:hypothetical protein